MLLLSSTAILQAQNRELVTLSDSLGAEIDANERAHYRLFPDIKDFQSAQIFRLSNDKYLLSYSVKDEMGISQKNKSFSASAFASTQLHVQLHDAYYAFAQKSQIEKRTEAEILYKLALKYAAQTRYEESRHLFNSLVQEFPDVEVAEQAKLLQAQVARLAQSKNALFLKGSLLDQSGRTELLLFSGYYGLWAGIAIPVALESGSPQAHALGLILGGPGAFALAYAATREANISDGQATLISLGGHLGTWQGIGWASVANNPGHAMVGSGLLAGLGGIGAATLLSRSIDFSTGHAEVTNSSAYWGTWFGLVAAILSDQEDKELLRTMLISTDVAVLSTGFLAKNVTMSKTRMRLIDLAGVVGTIIGFGVDMLIEVDDEKTAFAIAGAGTVAGLLAGIRMTENFDKGREISLLEGMPAPLRNTIQIGKRNLELSPQLSLRRHPVQREKMMPVIGIQIAMH